MWEDAGAPAAKLLTMEQAGQRLNVGRTMLYELIAAGRLRSVKVGRSRRVVAKSVDELVDYLVERS